LWLFSSKSQEPARIWRERRLEKGTKRTAICVGVLVALLGFSSPSSASLIYNSQLFITGSGPGTGAILTIHAVGQDKEETGCTARNGSAIVLGSAACSVLGIAGAQTGTGAGQSSAPTLGSFGIINATELAIVFDSNQSGKGPITLANLALKLTRADGTVYYSATTAAGVYFASTDPGVGSAGFAFTLDPAQAAQANALGLLATDRIALEAAATGFSGGPESFFAAKVPGSSVPDGGMTVALLGLALLGLGVLRRKFGA
jgi:hypothetical protein